MEQGSVILDEALELARQEKKALEEGEYDAAIEMAEKRAQLTGMAYNSANADENFRLRLVELAKIQKQLTEIATKARDMVRARMNRSRQEKKRIRGYQMAVNQALQ